MSDHHTKEPQPEQPEQTEHAEHAPSFMVEVKDLRPQGGGEGRFELNSAATKKIVGATEDMIRAVHGAVRDVCRMAYGAFAEANRPDEISVKFGVKVGGKAGGGWIVLVTEATGEATLEFQAKWTNPKLAPAKAPDKPSGT